MRKLNDCDFLLTWVLFGRIKSVLDLACMKVKKNIKKIFISPCIPLKAGEFL